MSLKTLLSALLVSCGVASAGPITYNFAYTATSGTVSSFSFSLVSPSYIGVGTPAMSPVTIFDDSNPFTLSKAQTGISPGFILGSTFVPAGFGCFSFGSPSIDLAQDNGCGAAGTYNMSAALTVVIPGGLPSAPGTYSNLIFDGVVLYPNIVSHGFVNCCGQSTGSMTLTVSDAAPVPEPASGGLLIAALGALLYRRRTAA